MSDIKMLEVMPETGPEAEKKVKVSIYLPPSVIESVNEMAIADGLPPHELYRIVFMLGANTWAESTNKRRINDRLRQKAKATEQIKALLESPDGQALISELIAKMQTQSSDNTAK